MHSSFLDKLFPAITWTLIHSLWQGLILALMAGAVMLLTRRTKAAHRYALLFGVFLVFISMTVLTFFIEWNGGFKVSQPGVGNEVYNSLPAFLPFRDGIEGGASFLNAHASWLILAWFMVFLFKIWSVITAISGVSRLRRYSEPEGYGHWSNKIQELAHTLSISKPVLLLQSSLIKVPVTVGHFKPLILVPVGMLGNMPPAQVEAVLLHELAHIRRHDYLVNLVQRFVESIFYFNPALLWISSLLRAERESCCDELAIEHSGSKLQYVEALIHCKESSMRAPHYALGFWGPQKRLHHRLNRIVLNRNKGLSPFELAFLSFSFILLIALFAAIREKKVSPNVHVSYMKQKTQQVDISEVWDRATESDEGAGRLEKKRNLPLPPPAARQTLPEIRIPPKANKKLGFAAADDQIEVDLTRQTAISEYNKIDKARVEAEGKSGKQILVNEMVNPK